MNHPRTCEGCGCDLDETEENYCEDCCYDAESEDDWDEEDDE